MSRHRPWLLYVAAWLPFAAGWGGLVWLSRQSVGFSLLAAVAMMGMAALLSLGVWQASASHPWPEPARGSRLEFVLRVVFAGLGYALVLVGLDAVLGGAFEGRPALEFLLEEPRWVLWQILIYCWLYGLGAGVAHALRAQQRLREREVAAARAEALAADAQLRALRAQLNPHFLFNALHSLGALVRHDRAAAEHALDRLGELLRYVLDEGSGDTVALADEWDFVRTYLDLERLRLGERLRVEADLEDDALDCAVPSFVLQPLVENAVRHAVAPRPEGGRVTISARVEAGTLRIRVSDDGPGTTRQAAESAPGLGLRALRQRIEAGGADASRLEIATAPGAGFQATVTLPVVAPAAP
jgi:signal transduction histidine kinase